MDELLKIQTEAGTKMYADLNRYAVDFSARALRAVFLLNGGAATALIAVGGKDMALFACSFGFGAFISVLAMLGAYLTNLAAAETWREFMDGKAVPAAYMRTYHFRLCSSLIIGILSAVWFLVTLILIAIHLS